MSVVVSPPLNGANRYAHIDAMRAFAVLLVVVAHAGLGHIVPGGSGVTIFFSISGFIITYLLLRERDKTERFSASDFYLRRAMKIGPPLVLIVLIPSLVSSMWQYIDWNAFAAQALFVFNWIYIDGEAAVLDGSDVVWSLSIEEQFYIVFALIWLMTVKLRHWRLVITAVAVLGVASSTTLRLLMAADPLLTDRIYYGSDTRLDGIAWGVLAGIAFHWLQERGLNNSRSVRLLASDWLLVGSLGIYIFSLIYRDEWFRDTFRYSLQSLVACSVILYGLLPGEGPVRRMFYAVSQWRLVSLIGLASYSIYLVHLVLMNWLRESLSFHFLGSVVLLSLIGVGAGVAIYKLVEIPVHKYGQNVREKRLAGQSVVP